MIYVCQEDMYNHTQGNELGYTFMSDFLAGRSWSINSNDATWQGNYKGNKSMSTPATAFKSNMLVPHQMVGTVWLRAKSAASYQIPLTFDWPQSLNHHPDW